MNGFTIEWQKLENGKFFGAEVVKSGMYEEPLLPAARHAPLGAQPVVSGEGGAASTLTLPSATGTLQETLTLPTATATTTATLTLPRNL